MNGPEVKQVIDRYMDARGVDEPTATRAILSYAALAMAQHMPRELMAFRHYYWTTSTQ